MSNTSDKDLINSYIKNLEISELTCLWENLTEEVNNPSVMLPMNFFLEDYLPECVSSKHMDVIELARTVTGDDGCVKHFDINDDYVYVNSLGLWESINEYNVPNLVIDFINDYNLIEYSNTIKNKLAELKEDITEEQ